LNARETPAGLHRAGGAAGWPRGYGRIIREEVGSTLDAARTADEAVPFWLLAHRQTAARGRRGRPWQMPAGNFAATLLMRRAAPPGDLALRSFAMALALHRALVDAAGPEVEARLALKWPNDVLLDGGKLAGILLESDGSGLLAIGVGVNLAAAPGAAEIEADALKAVALRGETGVSTAPETFLDLLARHFAEEEARLCRDGFAPLRADWLARATMLGRTITARLPRREIVGTFAGLDDAGNLLLDTAQGQARLAAAEIFF
jgi:BirA family biotin operon repressor/biotin-[acetyl-CoA-carboxylase] ligase